MTIGELWRRVVHVARRSREADDLRAEMQLHIDLRSRANQQAGAHAADATFAARRQFGNQTRLRGAARDAWGFVGLDAIVEDIRLATRSLIRSPVFTVAVSLTLAIGIGANTAVIGIIDAAFFRKLPVPSPEQVVAVYSGDTRAGSRASVTGYNSFPDYLDLRRLVDGGDGLAAYAMTSLKLGDSLSGAEVWSALVTANYFSVIGVHAARGRLILPDEDEPRGAHPVVVISDAFWKARFGGDEHVVGQQLTIGGGKFTVIGVAPPGFTGMHPEGRTDLWLPWTMEAEASGRPPVYANRDARLASIIGRLAPGSSLARVQASLDHAAAELKSAWPALDGSLKFRVARHDRLVMIEQAPMALVTMLMVWTMIVLLHLIACSNVASLVLARAAARRKELGIRLCLGASRGRILMHSLAEPAVLAAVGATGGVLIARWLTLLITRMQFLSAMDPGLDLRALAIVALAAIATVLVFGLAPALEASRPDPMATLRGTAGGPRGGRRRDAAPLLVIGQVAMSLVLLVNAAILTRTFERQSQKDPGFDAPHLLVASVALRGTRAQWGDLSPSLEQMIDRASRLPGVRRVAVAGGAPLLHSGWYDEVVVAGHQYSDDESRKMSVQVVGPAYFTTVGASLAKGREFNATDLSEAAHASGTFDAVVVNEAMARRYWPNDEAIGKQVAFRHRGTATVIGVVRDLHDVTLSAIVPRAYFPLSEWRIWPRFELIVLTNGDPAALEPALRAMIGASSMPVEPPLVQTMRDVMSDSLQLPHIGGIALTICAAVALLLTSVGLYGLVASFAAQRRSEIGIRLALGARARHVHTLVLGGAGRLVAIGAAVGLVGALAMIRVERGLWGPSIEFEGFPIVLALVVLGVVVSIAAFVPSLRATRSDPAEVLRTS